MIDEMAAIHGLARYLPEDVLSHPQIRLGVAGFVAQHVVIELVHRGVELPEFLVTVELPLVDLRHQQR